MAEHRFSKDPFTGESSTSTSDGPSPQIPKCPRCGETGKIEVKAGEWGIERTCGRCGNQWSATMGLAKIDPTSEPPPPPGVPAPDDELPLYPDYRPGFRRGSSYDWED